MYGVHHSVASLSESTTNKCMDGIFVHNPKKNKSNNPIF